MSLKTFSQRKRLRNELVARPQGDGRTQVYLGVFGPSYVIPDSELGTVRIWWDQRPETPQKLNWLWFLILVPSLAVLYFSPEYAAAILVPLVLWITWSTRRAMGRLRDELEQRLPGAKRQSGAGYRMLKSQVVFMPRWYCILCVILGAPFLVYEMAKFVDRSFFTINEAHDALAYFSILIGGLVISLLAPYGLYFTVLHFKFRHKFKRAPTADDLIKEIDWFDKSTD